MNNYYKNLLLLLLGILSRLLSENSTACRRAGNLTRHPTSDDEPIGLCRRFEGRQPNVMAVSWELGSLCTMRTSSELFLMSCDQFSDTRTDTDSEHLPKLIQLCTLA